MYKRNKKLSAVSIAVAAFVVFANISSISAVYADQNFDKQVILKKGSLNKVLFQDEKNAPLSSADMKRGNASTYVRVPQNTKSKLQSDANLPSTYDLRQQSGVTSVKNQGNINACWAFAADASLESYIKKSDSSNSDYDFSENNMITHSGFDLGPNDGGNRDMATAYFVRWGGPVNESDDPYASYGNPNNIVKRDGIAPAKHIQNVDFLPGTADGDKCFSNNAFSYDTNIYNAIKQVVMTNGAVDTSLYIPEDNSQWPSYLSNDSKSYYFYDNDSGIASDHDVAIVGWNDNYSASNFPKQAPGNGAFLCKNSWGTKFGDGGYFYVSYYDRFIGNEGTSFKAESSTNYGNIYQYDMTGMNGNIYSKEKNNDEIYFSNVFTSSRAEALKAVGFYTAQPSTSFQAYLIKDYETNGFKNMTPMVLVNESANNSVSVPFAGYHTFQLSTPINLIKDHKFAVVIKLNGNGQIADVPLDECSSYTSSKTAQSGAGFVMVDGNDWTDVTQVNNTASVCLKAYTGTTDSLSVVSSSIVHKQTNVPISTTSVTVNFNKNIQAGSNIISLSDEKGRLLNTTPSISNNTLTISWPASVLEYGTNYNINIPKDAIKDLSGNTLSDDYIINFQTEAQGVGQFSRIFGHDRYDTAQKLVEEGWQHSNYAVLVTGDDWPDALSATALAKADNNAPLLLTNSKSLSPQTEAEIDRMGVKNVVIVGGTGAVSTNVENTLKTKNISVTRLYGKNRFETSSAVAVSVANLMYQEGTPISKAIVATGNDFADALSIASFSGSTGIPIVLTDKTLPGCAANFISNWDIKSTYVIGGTGVISNAVTSLLPSPTRFGGVDRFDTNRQVIAGLSSNFDPTATYFATGNDFPDALAASSVAALTKSPIVLTSNNVSKYTIDVVNSVKQNIKVKYVLGGNGIVSDNSIISLLK